MPGDIEKLRTASTARAVLRAAALDVRAFEEALPHVQTENVSILLPSEIAKLREVMHISFTSAARDVIEAVSALGGDREIPRCE